MPTKQSPPQIARLARIQWSIDAAAKLKEAKRQYRLRKNRERYAADSADPDFREARAKTSAVHYARRTGKPLPQ